MNNKGFTLVELLGVIVIVGVLALAIGISVTSILRKSKSELSDIQIENIENAAKTYYLKEGINESNLDLEKNSSCVEVQYLIDNDYIDASEITNPVDNDEILGSVKITYDSKKYKYTYQEKSCYICSLVSGDEKEIGSKYECEVKKGTKYNFYVLSNNDDGTTNLIMDRNICEDGTPATEENTCLVSWVSKIDYNNDLNYGEYGNNDKGPITAMNYLTKATKEWENIQNLDIIYDDEMQHFTNFVVTSKARLPYYKEVSDYDGTNGHLYDNLAIRCVDGDDNLMACENAYYIYGVLEDGLNHINEIYGYWTFSSHSDSSDGAFVVQYDGMVGISSFENEGNGVRPVITLEI